MNTPLIISGIVLLVLLIGGVFGFVALTLEPGPMPDFTDEYHDLQLANRPTPDTPDAWPDIQALAVLMHNAAYETGQHEEPLPDFNLLYDFDAPQDERDRIRESSLASFSLLYEWDSEMDDDPEWIAWRAHASKTLRRLESQDAALVDRVANARWAQFPCRLGADQLFSVGVGRQLAMYLFARAGRDWHAGDLAAVASSLRAYFGIVRSLEREPALIYRVIAQSLRTMLTRRMIVLTIELIRRRLMKAHGESLGLVDVA